MGLIFYLMGKSASGKDTVYRSLLSDPELRLESIVLYTTRPIRTGEKNGVDYHFVDEREYLEIRESGKIVEERLYQSAEGPWRYFTVDDGKIGLSGQDYLVIGTLESYLDMIGYFGKDKVCPIYMEVEDGERLQRALTRERQESEPKYAEMCRRFLADTVDFSEDKLEEAGITRRFDNRDGESCLKLIRAYVAQEKGLRSRNGH